MNELERMLEDQRAFNRMIFNRTTATDKGLIERLKDLTFGVVEESLEFIKTFEFKVHRRSKLRMQNVAHSHEELVDMFKYWLSLADLTDFPLARLEELYMAKSRVVQYRYPEEWVKRLDRPAVIVDIDQVLGDYISAICRWGKEYGPQLMGLSNVEAMRVGHRLDEIDKAKSWVNNETVGVEHLQWQKVKHDFRTRGGKRGIAVFPDAKPFLEWCRSKGWIIILVTSRPVNEYPNIFTDTLMWLDDNRLPFDHVWWAAEKGERIEEEAHIMSRSNIVFAVDDSPRFVEQFRARGIRTFHLDRSLKSFVDTDPTHYEYHIRSLHDLMSRWERRNEMATSTQE